MKPPGARALSTSAQDEDLGVGLLDPYQAALHKELDDLRRLQHKRAVDGASVTDLSMVNPDLPPPRMILDRLLESVTKSANHRYAVSRGVRRLREAFSHKYKTCFQQELDPETQVCVCLGSKDATFHVLRVLVKPGDAVIVPTPAYPAHPSAVALAAGMPVAWEVSSVPEEAAGDLSKLLASSKAKVLLLNFPSNPAGAVVSRSWWYEVGKVCAQNSVTIVNDFVYGEMCFSGEPAESALWAASTGARCVEVYSLSKSYNVPGWRVGALVGDRSVVAAVARLKSQADYGLFLPLQYASSQALSTSENLVAPTVHAYQRRLRVLGSGLRELGWHVTQPFAGACLWVQYPERLGSVRGESRFQSINVARHLLTDAGVVASPGVLFGEGWDSWLRFAAVINEERLRDVVNSLRALG
jgi:alanine-synthesizing transaminase